MEKDYVKKFCKHRKHLIVKYPAWHDVRQVDNQSFPTIELTSPELLANFSGYLKYQLKKKAVRVFCRGENSNHKTTAPSLFRPNLEELSQDEIDKRKCAFYCLVRAIPKIYEKTERFKTKDLKPLLQHYGIKTDWLDLVDNIFVALWFANHDSQKKEDKYVYIKFFRDSDLEVKELREDISSLSLRPHCQHGISVTRREKWKPENLNLDDHLLAVARLPKSTDGKSISTGISKKFLFPDKSLDNTYKLLLRDELKEKIEEIEKKYELTSETLGRVA